MGQLTHFECLPHSWFSWEEELEDDVIRRHVLVFESQAEAYDDLHSEIITETESIPEDITDGFAEKILREYFGDIPDPQPSVHDIKILLSAFKRGKEVVRTPRPKSKRLTPRNVALDCGTETSVRRNGKQNLWRFFRANPLCAPLYHGEFRRETIIARMCGAGGRFRLIEGQESARQELNSA